MKKRIKKIAALAMAVCMLYVSIMPAWAEIKGMRSFPVTGYKVYHNIMDYGEDVGGLSFFTIDGKAAFCIQSGRAVRGSDGQLFYPGRENAFDIQFTTEILTEDDSAQSRIAYLGYYSLADPDMRDYAFTQMMIWQTLPAQSITANGMTGGKYNSYFADKTVNDNYLIWKKKIEQKLKSWDKQPDFGTGRIGVKAGESTEVTELSGALADYEDFSLSKDGITVSHKKGNNKLKVTASKYCTVKHVCMTEKELTDAGAVKYPAKEKVNYVYKSDKSQDMAIYGAVGSVPVSLEFDVKTVHGKIAIEKTKAPDGYSDEKLPESGAEFQIYPTSAKSYDYAREECRDILITDIQGKAVTKALPYGTYTVHQIKGAEGHIMTDDFNVEITADQHDKIYKYNIMNETIKSDIRIVKKDSETGKVIPQKGVSYVLTNKITGEKIPGPEKDGCFATDENGYITPDINLCYGTYILTEIKAPDGYVLGKPVEFQVNSDRQTVIIEQFDMAQKGVIKIEKTGEIFKSVKKEGDKYIPVFDAAPIEGAEFKIVADEDIVTADGTVRLKKDEVADIIITDVNGKATSKKLYLGKYKVTETKTASGFVKDSTPKTAELTYKGQEVQLTETQLSVKNQRQKAQVTISKIFETDGLYGMDTGESYLTARFGLFAAEQLTAFDGTRIPEDGLIETVSPSVTDKKDIYEVSFESDVPLGSYYIRELSAPEGYVKDEKYYPVIFSPDDNCRVIDVIRANSNIPVINRLVRGEISGIKKDEKGEAVAGAVIGIFREADVEEGKPLDGDKAVLTAVTEKDGFFSFDRVPFGKYVIAEIKQPEGFLLSQELIPVTIDEDGLVINLDMVNEHIPTLNTYAYFEGGSRKHQAGGDVTVIDKVKYTNLMKKHPYTIKATLIDKTTGKAVAISQKSFIPEGSDGKITMEFTFNTGQYAETGGQLVVFQELYRDDRTGEKKVAGHDNINDKDQTVCLTAFQPPKTSDDADWKPYAFTMSTTVAVMAVIIYIKIHRQKKI